MGSDGVSTSRLKLAFSCSERFSGHSSQLSRSSRSQLKWCCGLIAGLPPASTPEIVRFDTAELEGSILSSLSAVFAVLNEMKVEGVFEDYALGGAMAVLFYAEPTRTYDLDVFVALPQAPGRIIQLRPIYKWLEQRGYRPEAEHVLIHGVPVQFLPAYNNLVEETVKEARLLDYERVPVRVSGPEHLVALCIQAGGRRRRERAFQLLESGTVDRRKLRVLFSRHGLPLEIFEDE